VNSIWQDNSFKKQYDLAVVGAGIVGLHAALFFKRRHPNKRVCVIEKGAFPEGASVKNAGFACFGSPSELLDDIENEGTDAAISRVALRWEGIQGLRHELGDEHIGIVEDGGFELFMPHDELYTSCVSSFDHLNDLLHPIFGKAVYAWDDEVIPRMGMSMAQHAASIQFEASLDTGRMMHALWRKTLSEGVVLHSNTRVETLNDSLNGAQLETEHGPIWAEQVIVAANAYSKALIPALDIVPGRGQVLLTSPISGLKLKGDHHLMKGYFYFRPYHDRVLIGGGRNLDKSGEQTLEEGTTDVIQDKLEKILNEVVLPGRSFTVEKRWSGIMAFGSSKDPIVDRISERIVVAVRSGGMGVAIGHTLGKRAAEIASS